jgi:hypothetical protein
VARLEHRGADPLYVDLSEATFVAVAWTGWYDEAARLTGPVPGVPDAPGEVGAGWSTVIPLADLFARLPPAVDPSAVTVHVSVTFSVGEGRDATQVELSHTPDLPAPT